MIVNFSGINGQSHLRRWCLISLMLLLGAFIAAPSHAQMWDNLDGHAGSLSPENLSKQRPKAPVDLTGTWMIAGNFRFTPLPKFTPQTAKTYEEAQAARAAGKTYNDDIGRCWPPGVPVIMTRVWPIHVIQLPTAIVMISNFENQVRWIYMDGREHSDPDLYVPSYNGESIGHWEGDTLVVDTRNVETKKHWIAAGVPISDQFRLIERIKLSDDGEGLEIENIMTDPENWQGQWTGTKKYKREHKVDFLEVHCLPDLNEGIPAISDEYNISTE